MNFRIHYKLGTLYYYYPSNYRHVKERLSTVPCSLNGGYNALLVPGDPLLGQVIPLCSMEKSTDRISNGDHPF